MVQLKFETIEVSFEVSIAVAIGVDGAVRRIVGAQTVLAFPRIRHAIMVGIGQRFG